MILTIWSFQLSSFNNRLAAFVQNVVFFHFCLWAEPGFNYTVWVEISQVVNRLGRNDVGPSHEILAHAELYGRLFQSLGEPAH